MYTLYERAHDESNLITAYVGVAVGWGSSGHTGKVALLIAYRNKKMKKLLLRVHNIILDGRDSQEKVYNPAMNFQVFEPDLFMEFFNTEVIKSRRDEKETLTAQVSTS